MMKVALLEGCGADQASWTEKQIICTWREDINSIIKVTLLEE
jgi:hypothetical protein